MNQSIFQVKAPRSPEALKKQGRRVAIIKIWQRSNYPSGNTVWLNRIEVPVIVATVNIPDQKHRSRQQLWSNSMSEFWQWWQHIPTHLDPVLLRIGPIRLHYYSLMYIAAFGTAYALIIRRLKTEERFSITAETAQGLVTAMIIGLLIGARLGYALFYNFTYYASHPLEIILPFSFSGGIQFTGISGMSYHGGLVGAISGAWIFIRRHQLNFREMADLCIPAIPLGYTFGRIGNFINGELWGRTTTAVYGMVFPHAPGSALRHASQLYEAFFEGIVLFIVLWSLRKTIHKPGIMLGLYLIGYGTARFFIEFAREPDSHLGLIAIGLSMGQLLCAAMILAGAAISLFPAADAKKQS